MRHKRLKLSALLLLVIGLTGLQAQTMYVKENNGTQTTEQLNLILGGAMAECEMKNRVDKGGIK